MIATQNKPRMNQSRAERTFTIQLSLIVLINVLGPTSGRDASTSASTSQLLLRVIPLVLLATPRVASIILGGTDPKPLISRPAVYWWGFCGLAGLGGLVLGRYPVSFTAWKSLELFLGLLIIAVAVSRCTFAEVERVIFRILQWYLVAVCIGVAIRPSSLRQAGGFFQLDSQIPPVTPNKLAIAAGLYLILLVGRPAERRSWRLAMALVLVAVALSRSVLGILLIGGPFFFDTSATRNLRRRIGITLASSAVALVSAQFITNVLTKGGAVSDDNIVTISGRTVKWETAWNAFREWPFGWGINGAFRDIFIPGFRGRGEILGNVHSSVVEAFLASGLVGGVLWMLFWLYPQYGVAPAVKALPEYPRVRKACAFLLIVACVDSGFVLYSANLLMASGLVLNCYERSTTHAD